MEVEPVMVLINVHSLVNFPISSIAAFCLLCRRRATLSLFPVLNFQKNHRLIVPLVHWNRHQDIQLRDINIPDIPIQWQSMVWNVDAISRKIRNTTLSQGGKQHLTSFQGILTPHGSGTSDGLDDEVGINNRITGIRCL